MKKSVINLDNQHAGYIQITKKYSNQRTKASTAQNRFNSMRDINILYNLIIYILPILTK